MPSITPQKDLFWLCVLLLSLFAMALHEARSEDLPSVSIIEGVNQGALKTEIAGDGIGQIRISISNTSNSGIRTSFPAGVVLKGKSGNRVIVLRTTDVAIPKATTVDVDTPVAALSIQNTFRSEPFFVTTDSEPRLSPLLTLLGSRNDIPWTTSQLAIFAILENISFHQWQQCPASQRARLSESDADSAVIEAIDVLGILREIAPGGMFALANDNKLKLRALRNPISRAKANQIYGLHAPELSDPSASSVPGVKQLLHMAPGDNCPVCRMRQQSMRGAGDL